MRACAQSAAVAAIVGALPSAPPVVAAWPSQNEVLSVRYLPPADAAKFLKSALYGDISMVYVLGH